MQEQEVQLVQCGPQDLPLDPGNMPNKPGRPRPSLELPLGLELFINPIDLLLVPPEDGRWSGELEVLELVP